MQWTSTQKAALLYKNLGKVIYKNMWVKYHQLGYSNKGSNTKYNVVIAKDAPSKDVRDIVTLHEVGHIIYNHLDVNLKKEFLQIKSLCDKHNKPYDLLSIYGGPTRFVNIAMDLEVNSKLFTRGNIKTMTLADFAPCTVEAYGLDTLDNFRDYYEPLIERMDSNMEKEENDLPLDIPRLFGAGNGERGRDNRVSKPSELENEVFGKQFEEQEVASPIETKEDEEEAFPIKGVGGNEGKEAGIGDFSNLTEVKLSKEELIANYIKACVRKPASNYVNDVIRLHNRGTRVNKQNILYSSKKRNHVPQPKFCFVLDVSGSMNIDPIMKALGTLNFFFKNISRDSEVLIWNTRLKERFSIGNIPSKIDMGGGTDMAAAITYAKKEGFTDCVLYSDLETDLQDLEDASKGINVYPICVDYNENSSFNPLKKSDFYNNHKRMLFI